MAVLPGFLGCRPLRRTVQVRLGTNTLRLPGGTPILFALATLRSVPQAGSQFRGLVTAIHEISGLLTLSQDYYQKLTGGKSSPETLIEESFQFFLERESNTMILARFDLPVIADYFPEYEKNIVKKF
jgi:hypothetical protein